MKIFKCVLWVSCNILRELNKDMPTKATRYDEPFPITKNLIINGRKNKILNKKIDTKIPVVLFHGLKDESVPLKFSKKILQLFKNSNKKIIKIKD